MRKIIFGLTFILLFGTFCFAQQNKTKQPVVENDSQATGKNPGATEDTLLKSGTNLDAQLQGTLDVKKSKVGDEVVLKTTKTIKENGEVIIPKGTKLIGKVTEVQQKTKDSAISKIGVVFETIEGKNLSAPINASIVSITNISNNTAVGDVFESNTSANTTGSASSGNSGGGGLLGGTTQAVGGVLKTTTQTVGGVTNTAGQTVGGATSTVGSTIKGLQISQTASGSANSSTTLSSADKNLKIEKGANFRIQLNKSVEN